MIRFLSGALIIASGWLMGNSLYTIYLERVKIVERFADFILFCEGEMKYFKTEMNLIIDKFTDKDNKYDKIIFDENNKSLYIAKETKQIINEFLDKVCTMDSDSQVKYFQEIGYRISKIKQKTEKDLTVKGKMLKKLCPIMAIGFFILIL